MGHSSTGGTGTTGTTAINLPVYAIDPAKGYVNDMAIESARISAVPGGWSFESKPLYPLVTATAMVGAAVYTD